MFLVNLRRCCAVLVLVFSANATADDHLIVTSIAPIHALAKAVAGDKARVVQRMPDGASPHGYLLKPSQMRELLKADQVFFVSPLLEDFLAKPQRMQEVSGEFSALADDAGIALLEKRSGDAWPDHHHHGEEGHDDEHSDEASSDHHEDDAHHAEEEASEHKRDMHIWLDPHNAIKIIEHIRDRLVATFPDDREAFVRNADAAVARLQALDAALAKQLAPVTDAPFVVFHDAYQYLERRYQLTAVGSILVDPDEPPSVQQVQQIRERIQGSGAQCVFSEVQFSDKLVATVTEGSSAKSAMLDPLGKAADAPLEGYVATLKSLADVMLQCLSSKTDA